MMLRRLQALLVLCLLAALSAGCDRKTAPDFTTAPVLTPSPAIPLTAILSAQTAEPAVLELRISDGDHSVNAPVSTEMVTSHSLPLLGFRPDRTYTLEVNARDEMGAVSDVATLTFATAPLPDYFPDMETLVSVPGKMEPGVTLFGLMRWPDGGEPDESFGLAIAVDAEGEVVWYRRKDPLFEDPHRLANGNLISIVGYNRAEEFDMLGNTVATWHAADHPNPEAHALVPEDSIPVAMETFHHDIHEMPSGNLLTLSTEMREVDDYPTSVTDSEAPTAKANVIGDVIVEFARDGSIVNEWRLMDMLDVRRLGYESLGAIWGEWAYVDVPGGTKDWSHGNSVFYDAATDSILVSLRHQEAVISFSRASGELNWILGPHEGWGEAWTPYLLQPEGELEWQYHQHAAEMTANGSLLLFDNGNNRALPPDPPLSAEDSYSRAVEYVIDAENRTVRQIWSHGGPGEGVFYSPFISEADQLPVTGNVLITDGGRVSDELGGQSDRIVGGHHWARIVEVTHTDTPETVFELRVGSQLPDQQVGWAVYRSERLPSLYPD